MSPAVKGRTIRPEQSVVMCSCPFLRSVTPQGVAIANIVALASRGFFYIDASNRVSYGGCFSSGDLFSLCLNGMAISVVSVMLASAFILKDFIMCALNSLSVSGVYSSPTMSVKVCLCHTDQCVSLYVAVFAR